MARSKVLLRTRDIDWAFASEGHYIHVSSAGGNLPTIVEDHLFEIWRELKNAEIVCESTNIVLNEQYLERKFSKLVDMNPQERDFRMGWYVHSFKAMAMRGFYSFDRDISTPFEGSKYHWIAKPGRNISEPHYKLPEIALGFEPEELEGSDIVAIINNVING